MKPVRREEADANVGNPAGGQNRRRIVAASGGELIDVRISGIAVDGNSDLDGDLAPAATATVVAPLVSVNPGDES